MVTYLKKRTSRKPFTIGGVEWASFQTGVNTYTVYDATERAAVWRSSFRVTYRATVDGEFVGKLFRSEKSACTAAAKKLKATPCPRCLGRGWYTTDMMGSEIITCDHKAGES